MSEALRRLPLRLERPPRGRSFRLQWIAADQALVLRGEPLCEAFTDGDPQPVRLLSPAAGRLYQLVPASDRVSADAILGELQSGSAWDEHMRNLACYARSEVGRRAGRLGLDEWLQHFERYRIAVSRGYFLAFDIDRWEHHLAERLPSLPRRRERCQRIAAALLAALSQAPPEFRHLWLTPADRELMAAVVARLQQHYRYAIMSPAFADPPAALRRIEAAGRLGQLYDDAIADCADRLRDFPPELQAQKLALWQELKQHELRRLDSEDN